jgi:hypothetical protein
MARRVLSRPIVVRKPPRARARATPPSARVRMPTRPSSTASSDARLTIVRPILRSHPTTASSWSVAVRANQTASRTKQKAVPEGDTARSSSTPLRNSTVALSHARFLEPNQAARRQASSRPNQHAAASTAAMSTSSNISPVAPAKSNRPPKTMADRGPAHRPDAPDVLPAGRRPIETRTKASATNGPIRTSPPLTP